MTTKAFPPSARKLKKAKENGDVAFSKNFSKSVVFAVVIAYLYLMPYVISSDVQALFVLLEKSASFGVYSPDEENMMSILSEGLRLTIGIIVPLLIVASVASVAVNIIQVGFCWNVKKLLPDLKKFNPIKNFKNLLSISEQEGDGKVFGAKICYDFTRAIIVLILLACIVYLIVCAEISKLFFLDNDDSFGISLIFSSIVFKVLATISAVLLLIGGVDLFLEKRRRYNRLRMDLEEVKRELKENEGNPEIIGMRKQLHREILSHNIAQGVRKAKVLVVSE